MMEDPQGSIMMNIPGRQTWEHVRVQRSMDFPKEL